MNKLMHWSDAVLIYITLEMPLLSDQSQSLETEKKACSPGGAALLLLQLPSACSPIQMSVSLPWEPHSLWKQFSAPQNGAEIPVIT